MYDWMWLVKWYGTEWHDKKRTVSRKFLTATGWAPQNRQSMESTSISVTKLSFHFYSTAGDYTDGGRNLGVFLHRTTTSVAWSCETVWWAGKKERNAVIMSEKRDLERRKALAEQNQYFPSEAVSIGAQSTIICDDQTFLFFAFISCR